MRCFDYSLGPKLSAGPSGWRVTDDFPTDAAIAVGELDAIEAFLSAHVRLIVEGASDSEMPQILAKTDKTNDTVGE